MQELNTEQINQAINESVEKHIPLTLTVENDGWKNLHSRFLAVQDGHLLVEIPPVEPGSGPYEFVPAEKVALSFKLRHHKYLSQARVAGFAQWKLDDGTPMQTLSLCFPMHMQRLQRRSFSRVAVPPGRVVRVSVWPGGKDCEPHGHPGEPEVLSARVKDLSAGGFQAVVRSSEPLNLEVGKTMGVRIAFGPGEESVYADVQYRHCDTLPNDTYALGFQFVGLAHCERGQQAMRLIHHKMSEFNRYFSRSRRSRISQ